MPLWPSSTIAFVTISRAACPYEAACRNCSNILAYKAQACASPGHHHIPRKLPTTTHPSFAISAGMGSYGVADLGRCLYTAGAGAVGTAEEPALHLNSMTDDPTLAVFAYRRQPLDGTLE